MFNWLCCKQSKPVYIIYKLKQNNIDTVIEKTNEHNLKKRLYNLKNSRYIYDKIIYDYDQNIALNKFYNS